MLPAATVVGPDFTIATSALATTVVMAEAESFDGAVSKLSVDAVAVLVTDATFPPTATTSVNVADAPLPSRPIEQVTVPVAPLAGVWQFAVGPVFWVSDWNVVPAGSGSVRVAFCAGSGPAFASMSM